MTSTVTRQAENREQATGQLPVVWDMRTGVRAWRTRRVGANLGVCELRSSRRDSLVAGARFVSRRCGGYHSGRALKIHDTKVSTNTRRTTGAMATDLKDAGTVGGRRSSHS